MEESQQGTYLQVSLQRMYKNIHKHLQLEKLAEICTPQCQS